MQQGHLWLSPSGPAIMAVAVAACSCSQSSNENLGSSKSQVEHLLNTVEVASLAGVSLPRHEDARLITEGVTLKSQRSLSTKVTHPAEVRIDPTRGIGFELRDLDSGMTIRVALQEHRGVSPEVRGSSVAWPHALGRGLHVVQTVGFRGVEDFVVADEGAGPPAVKYSVELTSGVAGLRLVDRVLEFLDAGGAPRLRMARPWVVDRHGTRLDATVRVEGCAVDLSPAPSWGRPPLKPGNLGCNVRVAWDARQLAGGVAVVDPAWMTTGTMVTPRKEHSALALQVGKVLVASGSGAGGNMTLATELFDPVTATWGATSPKTFGAPQPMMVLLASGKAIAASPGQSETYDPATGHWTPSVQGPASIGYPSGAALLGTGRVIASTSIYDPVSNNWSSMPEATFTAWASLSDGRALGCNAIDCTVYNDSNATWTATGAPPSNCYATRLIASASGSVYAIGTSGCAYLPASNAWIPGGPSCDNCQTAALSDGTIASASSNLYGGGGIPNISGYPGAFFPAPTLNRSGFTFTALMGGNSLLLAGGVDNSWSPYPLQAQAELLVTNPSPQGAKCSFGPECQSGYCIDGVCCDTQCGQLCQACSSAKKGKGNDGVCEAIASGFDPDNDCPADGSVTCGLTGSCDGTGACAKYGSATLCKSSCSGALLSQTFCDGNGSCSVQPGDTSCGLFVCGSLTACATSCVDDAGCASSAFCNASSQTCVPDRATGAACDRAAQCASTHCVDGVCCDTACQGLCTACVAAKTGTVADGSCGPVVADTDPDNDCPADNPSTCGRTGMCDGSGACGRYVNGTLCQTSCESGTLTQWLCNGSGSCATAGPSHSCGAYGCASASVCAVVCSNDSGCAASAFCDAATELCAPDLVNGTACTRSAQCASNYCVDGTCCDSPCNGLCQACSAVKKGSSSDGVCGDVVTGTDPDNDCPEDGPQTCARSGQCDGAGKCAYYPPGTACGSSQCVGNSALGKLCSAQSICFDQTVDCKPYKCMLGACPHSCSTDNDCTAGNRCVQSQCIPKSAQGTACSDASECESTFCVDSVCCDSLCSSQCEACNEPGHAGTCIAINGVPRAGRPACTGDPKECGGSCGGGKRDGCEYADTSKFCGNTRCEGNVFKPETCDGLGSCVTAATKDCGDYACDSVEKKCKVRCSTGADCATGRDCNPSTEQCTPLSHDCKDKYTALGSNGAEVDCAPYSCAAGACRDSCSVTSDCVQGFACEGGRCRLSGGPGDGGTSDIAQVSTEKGCGCSAAGRRSQARYALLFAITFAFAAGRRRRRNTN